MAVGAKSLLSSASHLVTSYIHLHHKLHARPPPHHHLLCRALVVVLLVPHRCKPPHTSARSETTAHGTFSSSSSSTSTTTTKLNTSTHTMAAAAAQFTPEQLALAEPMSESEVGVEAWYMDDLDTDQRLEHRLVPNQPCSLATLRDLGVLAWKLDADAVDSDPRLAAIRAVRGYSYVEVIEIAADKLPGYEQKIKSFYEEHIHADEEIRYVLGGTGYFDVRDLQDRWIRIRCSKGDLIVLPEGIYHRFTLDTSDYIKAMRLFVGEPVWTPHNRPQEAHPSRTKYLQAFKSSTAGVAAA